VEKENEALRQLAGRTQTSGGGDAGDIVMIGGREKVREEERGVEEIVS
jgi:hypothetical protein